jgi:pimeloyl-ACP methyl ester carboxylesterase
MAGEMSARSRDLTRRQVMQVLGAAAASTAVSRRGVAQTVPAPIGPYRPGVLPQGVRSRFVENINGLRMHVLEAGFEPKDRPLVLMIHGFPELAYSWRKIMGPVAAAGYHVIAPDVRGYGRTSGTDVKYDDDLAPFRSLNQVRDMLGLVSAFGYRSTAAVVGHDQGSPLAGWCAVTRPDVFKSVVMMSAPFGGPPALPFNTADAPAGSAAAAPADPIYDELAALKPPRKHYQRYYTTREANENLWHPPQGLHAFIRAYYHMKSADWKQNKPAPLAARTAAEWAKLPRYYVMDLDKGMAETVAAEMPSAAEIAANRWLPDAELDVYAEEYGRTGFQGGLEGYRTGASGRFTSEQQLFAGRTIDQPSLFVSGKSDWGVYQAPGSLERMQKVVCTRMLGVHLVDGAGHWVQQEQPEAVSRLIVQFLQTGARA